MEFSVEIYSVVIEMCTMTEKSEKFKNFILKYK